MLIRKAKIEDKEKVNQAHIRSIREVCAKDYTEDQIAKWSNLTYTDDVWSKTVHKNCCYVIEVNENIFGFCHSYIANSSEGEIAGLYLTPEVIGKGFGRIIFSKCIEYLKENNCKKAYLYSTKTSQKFYQRMGFKLIETKMITLRGTSLESHYMEMEL